MGALASSRSSFCSKMVSNVTGTAKLSAKLDSEAGSGRVGFVSSRFCWEIVSNLTGAVKLSALVWPCLRHPSRRSRASTRSAQSSALKPLQAQLPPPTACSSFLRPDFQRRVAVPSRRTWYLPGKFAWRLAAFPRWVAQRLPANGCPEIPRNRHCRRCSSLLDLRVQPASYIWRLRATPMPETALYNSQRAIRANS